MEATAEAGTFLDKIKPPLLENAGLEDCALPPESIKEAFLKAASAVRSVVYASDDEHESRRCVDDPWEDSSDALVGIKDGVTAPAGGCAAEKGGGLTEAPGDEVKVVGDGEAEGKSDVVVEPGLPEGGEACVDGLMGLGIGEKGGGILGKKADVADDDDDEEDEGKEKPILAEGVV